MDPFLGIHDYELLRCKYRRLIAYRDDQYRLEIDLLLHN
jgi:hypothetical protein